MSQRATLDALISYVNTNWVPSIFPQTFVGSWTAGGTPGTAGSQTNCTITVTSGTLQAGQLLILDSGASQDPVLLTSVTGNGPYTCAFTTAKTHTLSVAATSPAVYKHLEPQPYPQGGAYPYLVVAPRSQGKKRAAGQSKQQTGFYRLTYVDRLGRPGGYSGVGAMMEAASDFADAFTNQITNSMNDITLALNGTRQVSSIGEGPGCLTQFDEEQLYVDEYAHTCYALPIDAFIHEILQGTNV